MRLAALLLCLALPVAAQSAAAPDDMARRAAAQLQQAAAGLERAGSARDRVAALTRTIRAYEAGLAAMREGLRRASARERTIRESFEVERLRLEQLIGALQSMHSSPEALLLLHPSGALGTARSGMVLSDVTPALHAEVEELRARLEELATLRALQDGAAQTLEEALRGVQEARTRLSQAISDRTELPRRVTEDPAQMRRLIESADTLEGFATSLASLPADPAAPDLPDFAAAKGDLELPVRGTVRRGFREPDAAGIRRPGLLVETAPGAVVTTPWPATIRYLGPLLDYGNVMILEPSGGYLLVFAGLDQVYGRAGDVLPAGSPIGLMPGADRAPAIPAAATEPGGQAPDETLYLELREGDAPVDPRQWFRLDED
ncbi:murein hydrolase activator EnvC family protein [Tranquillimonas alkanivorans]|uniref:Septal ring factor EnvC, activator of murein hydrolases AmiA and AmiB n=1 Tax=Tranquillimonas alkanivorans TaxID=441119 RepID=A0A1I5PDP2_9RHOB|nr:peptidoglycan DD-metalloendopeptidase family protein [Tranquillimonas alkanivorans]SFP32218.1 Septal ring factor EnvC, activator of murein hydrolases AmiA and AmiB [Tranquillimonas alkanivorans]